MTPFQLYVILRMQNSHVKFFKNCIIRRHIDGGVSSTFRRGSKVFQWSTEKRRLVVGDRSQRALVTRRQTKQKGFVSLFTLVCLHQKIHKVKSDVP